MSVHENNNTGHPGAVSASPDSVTAGLQHQHLEEGTLNEIIISNGGSDSKDTFGVFRLVWSHQKPNLCYVRNLHHTFKCLI